jgi:hypothetical protein
MLTILISVVGAASTAASFYALHQMMKLSAGVKATAGEILLAKESAGRAALASSTHAKASAASAANAKMHRDNSQAFQLASESYAKRASESAEILARVALTNAARIMAAQPAAPAPPPSDPLPAAPARVPANFTF